MKKTLPYSFALILLSAASIFSARAQDCGCDFVINPPGERTTPLVIDGALMGVEPGQTICLQAGFYVQIRLIRISGKPGHPVTIKNCGGPVQIGDEINFGRWYATDIVQCNYIRFTGSGDPSHKYGIKLGKSGDSGLKIGGFSTNTEIDHLEIANTGFAGILAKTDFGGRVPVNAPEMNDVNIHDTFIHDTHGEGMYIGETRTPGQNFRHLEVWNNIITRTGLDLIQVANTIEDVQVHHNVFYNGGLRNVLFQNKGFQIGDNSVGRYNNNFIIGSASNSMIVMGSGDIEIFNNYLQASGDPGFFVDNRSVTIAGAPIRIHKNYLMEVKSTSPFFQVYNEKNPIIISENKLEGDNAILWLGSGAGPNVTQVGNTREVIERVQFADVTNNDFTLSANSPYAGIGLLENTENLNRRPYVALIADEQLIADTRKKVTVQAKDPDGDGLILEAFNLPKFVTFTDRGSGQGIFNIAPVAADTGVYYKVRVRVTDAKGSMNTQYFAINVLAPPQLVSEASLKSSSVARSITTSESSPESITSEGSSTAINLYPNPITDKVTLDLGFEKSGFVSVEICDLVGRSFYQRSWSSASQFLDLDLRTDNMRAGIYLTKVKVDGIPLKIIRLVKQD